MHPAAELRPIKQGERLPTSSLDTSSGQTHESWGVKGDVGGGGEGGERDQGGEREMESDQGEKKRGKKSEKDTILRRCVRSKDGGKELRGKHKHRYEDVNH